MAADGEYPQAAGPRNESDRSAGEVLAVAVKFVYGTAVEIQLNHEIVS